VAAQANVLVGERSLSEKSTLLQRFPSMPRQRHQDERERKQRKGHTNMLPNNRETSDSVDTLSKSHKNRIAEASHHLKSKKAPTIWVAVRARAPGKVGHVKAGRVLTTGADQGRQQGHDTAASHLEGVQGRNRYSATLQGSSDSRMIMPSDAVKE
jgi:hypothetical protein